MEPDSTSKIGLVEAFLETTELPSHAALIRDVLAQKDADEPSFEYAIKLISNDPLLSKRLIHLANSVWYGARVKVESPAAAFARFGVEKFCTLCISSVARQALHSVSDTVWPHLEFVAEFCQILAERVAPDFAEDGYWAGLLHDYAVPFMVKGLPDYCYWVDGAIASGGEVVSDEEECHEFSHVDAGAAITRLWGFNDAVSEAIAVHHRQSGLAKGISPAGARTAALVVIAERVAESGKGGAGHHTQLDLGSGILGEAVALLGHKPTEMKDHINEMCALVAVRAST